LKEVAMRLTRRSFLAGAAAVTMESGEGSA
jgi:hypothetical protein